MPNQHLNWKLPAIVIATGCVLAVIYTVYIQNKQQKQKVKKVPIANINEERQESKQLPLPGYYTINKTFDLAVDLLKVKQLYKDKYRELLPRSWRIVNAEAFNKSNCISVMQFNMLADGLSGAYTANASDKTFLSVDKECLQWTYRGLRICEEITRFSPDIICMQECDQFQFLQEYLEPFGYESVSQIIKDSATQRVAKQLSQERNQKITMKNCRICIFYKSDKFTVNDSIQQIDNTQNEAKVAGLAASFKCSHNQNRSFLCITTHLKSKKTQTGEEIRRKQINLLLKKLIKNEHILPIILCCDLNANPIQNKNGYNPLCYNSIIDGNNGIGYKSIYRLASHNKQEPEYTTWKCRKHGTDKHTIDYIFVSDENAWNIAGILEIPNFDEEELSHTKAPIPGWLYPSDHFSLMAKLCWKEA